MYDLWHCATQMRQASRSIKIYYDDLQGFWEGIDCHRHKTMECTVDIYKYITILHEDIVYIVLDGLDDQWTRSGVMCYN